MKPAGFIFDIIEYMIDFLKKIKNFFLNLFFPKKCLGCGKHDTYLCKDCFNKIEIFLNNTCFFCGKITGQGRVCLECQKENYLDRVISATNYANPLIRELIQAFKYHYVKELAEPLSKLLIRSLENNSTTSTNSTIIVPIPLYGTRLRYRGFNQAELLGKKIAEHFNLPMENNILKRIIATSPQVNIKNEEKRKANIEDAFGISEPSRVQGKIIILVDDVATTGATLIEAGKILKKFGAKEVWALVVAKG
jgi:ComF family protein